MITGKVLKARGWPEGRLIGLAKAVAERLQAEGFAQDTILARLDQVWEQPAGALENPLLASLATEVLRLRRLQEERAAVPVLHADPLPYRVWGAAGIQQGARAQMDAAMRLPISVAGALMPDAHPGYGLPIGGVLATEGAVIPYAVGVDIPIPCTRHRTALGAP